MNEALTFNPHHTDFLNNLGLCYYMLHQFSEAEKILKGFKNKQQTPSYLK